MGILLLSVFRCTFFSNFVPLSDNFRLKKYDSNFEPGKEPSFYPFWVASVTGPVVCIVAVAHTLLWKQLSGIVGSIVSIPVYTQNK